jgi:hypothetical protein
MSLRGAAACCARKHPPARRSATRVSYLLPASTIPLVRRPFPVTVARVSIAAVAALHPAPPAPKNAHQWPYPRKNKRVTDDFTVRYAVLLEYYGMIGTRNNRGQGHENGRVKF